MAKSGTIAVSAGHASQTAENASVIAEVAPPRPTSATLGSVVKNAFAGLSVAGLALIDTANRKVGIGTRNADFYNALRTKLVNLSGDTFEMVPADASKNSAGWTIKKNGAIIGQTLTGSIPTGVGLALTDALGFTQPARSLESLVSAIEDSLAEAGVEGVILIDQVAEKVWMSHCADLSAEWNDPTASMFGAHSLQTGTTLNLTVDADVNAASGIPDGYYKIQNGSADGAFVTVTSEVSSGPLGDESDLIDLLPWVTTDATTRKVALVTQTVSAVDNSGTGMFAS